MKSFKNTGTVCIILLCSMLLTLAGCGDAAQSADVTMAADTAESSSAVTETVNSDIPDGLPEKDFEGYSFNFLTRKINTVHYSVTAEEENGEVLNDAVYARNRKIEERYNFTLTETTSDNAEYARTYILAGDNTFDAMHSRCTAAFSYMCEHLIYNISDIPYIDLSKPWWDDTFNASVSIADKQYMSINAFNLTSYDFVHVLLFNKDVCESYSMPSLYELVSAGGWTYDQMAALMQSVTKDINGDGVMNENDAYGFVSAGKQVLPDLWISAGVLSVSKDDGDMPYLSMGDTKFADVFEKIFNITWDNGAWYVTKDEDNVPQSSIDMFKSGQALFMDSTFYFVANMRDMETDFGIIPFPKYDEAQNDYFSRVEFFDSLAVPVTNSELERTGIILEALAAESYKNVLPAYYETALKTKYSRDEQSSAMLDLIFSTRVVDLGDTIFVDVIRDGTVSAMFKSNKRDLASKITSISSKIDKKLALINEAFEG